MFKPVLIATAVLAITGSSLVYAQQRPGDPGTNGDTSPSFGQRQRPSPEDMAAFANARIAALKAGLELTPDQAKNWPPLEQALHDLAQLRIEFMQARQQRMQAQAGAATAQTSPFDRLAQRADSMAKLSAVLKRVADAGRPLYQSLSDVQKNRFKMLAIMMRPHHRHMPAYGQGYGGGRAWPGYGRRGDWRGFRGPRFGQQDPGAGAQMPNKMENEDPDSDL